MSGLYLPYDLPDAMSTAFDSRNLNPYARLRLDTPWRRRALRGFINAYVGALADLTDAQLSDLLAWARDARGEWGKVLWWEVLTEQDMRRELRARGLEDGERREQLRALGQSTPYEPPASDSKQAA